VTVVVIFVMALTVVKHREQFNRFEHILVIFVTFQFCKLSRVRVNAFPVIDAVICIVFHDKQRPRVLNLLKQLHAAE
jgi:uncharacterized membrane protein YciS (DUF1049 family)